VRITTKVQKKAYFEVKSVPRKNSLAFLFVKVCNVIKSHLEPEKIVSSKKGNTKYLFSTEINLNTNSSSKCFDSILTKLAKPSYPNTELVEGNITHCQSRETFSKSL
jgi:hypothetical protein